MIKAIFLFFGILFHCCPVKIKVYPLRGKFYVGDFVL